MHCTAPEDSLLMDYERPSISDEDLPLLVSLFCDEPVHSVQRLAGIPNVTFRAATSRTDVAIRISNNGYTSEEHLPYEVALLQHLAASGFPHSPRLVKGRNGEFIQRWRGYRVCATRFILGERADARPITRALCVDIGRAIANLTSQLASFDGPLPESEAYSKRLDEAINLFPAIARRLNWPAEVNAALELWPNIRSTLAEGVESVRAVPIHTDIWPPNVICWENQVTGIVDFDECSFGPSALDLCNALAEFPAFLSDKWDRGLVRAILEGYMALQGESLHEFEDTVVPAMQAACMYWLACNALHGVSYRESQVYVRKILALRELESQFKREVKDVLHGF
jgi:Ser/Thr protein kinase RdoA (MazF antagonist)